IGMGSAVGAVVSVAILRELGPVLTALMVTGGVGAAMSAEIGTMKVTEQIDALRALAVYPTDYLVVPRALAMMVSMPLLVAECIAVGIAVGYFVAIFLLEVNRTYYMANMVRWTRSRDIIMGRSRAFCFRILIGFISCHTGLTAREGAVDVGRGETLAIIGRSGGGKSVLLKHLIGLMRPDAGQIWIEGQNIIDMSERNLASIRQKVGILFQGSALFDSMTVAENIAFPLREAGERDAKVLRKRVSEMLEVMELQGQEEKMPVNLSGGM